MKRTILTILLTAGMVLTAQAQWLRVWKGEESTRYAMSDVKTLPYDAAGSTFTIGEENYSTAEIDSIIIINAVTITWTEDGATVDIPESVEGVTAKIDGGYVTITNKNDQREQEFILQGSSKDGAFTYNGVYKTKFHLNGINLTSTKGSAMDIECGKRIDLILEDGTSNSFTDVAKGKQTAAFYCKGHMEISHGGSLTITGKTNRALSVKEYLFLKKTCGTITINGALSDGIRAGEYFKMNGGNLVIKNVKGDGLQVETDYYSDEEENGQFIMNGGSIYISMMNESVKGIRLDEAEVPTDGNGKPLPYDVIPEMYLNDGTITIDVDEEADGVKCIASDGNLTIGTEETAPTITLNVDGGMDDDDERATGLKATNTLWIAGGTTTVNATGDGARGVRAYKLRATPGGTLTVTATGKGSQGIKLNELYISEGGIVKGKFIIAAE